MIGYLGRIGIMWIVGVIVVWLSSGALGAWVAFQKGRGASEGFTLGVLFGPFGVLIEALLPNRELPMRAEETIEEDQGFWIASGVESRPWGLDQLRTEPEPPTPETLPPIKPTSAPFDDIDIR
jgi:hypothetical protein